VKIRSLLTVVTLVGAEMGPLELIWVVYVAGAVGPSGKLERSRPAHSNASHVSVDDAEIETVAPVSPPAAIFPNHCAPPLVTPLLPCPSPRLV
jgi:hypothetical protein